MDSIVIEGGIPLKGSVNVSGAKNACLALMPAAILTGKEVILSNVPDLSDITTMVRLLTSLGLDANHNRQIHQVSLNGNRIDSCKAEYDIVRKMRASFLVLGPLVARTGRAEVSLPGGCAIGARAVDLHLMALKRLGAQLELTDGYVKAIAPDGLKGGTVDFPRKSVGATENAILAATLAKGETTINNAAVEPEVGDLIDCLIAMGATIEGKGKSQVTIQGQSELNGASHRVIPDRIELGTYCLAAGITGGEIELTGCNQAFSENFLDKVAMAGIEVGFKPDGLIVSNSVGNIDPVDFRTEPYPGFPTDLQAQMMAVLSLADGTSEIDERIFENRFMHVPELRRMGASIELNGSKAVVRGVRSLIGAPVMATDLRASVALVLAGLAAEGKTRISRVYHLDRGYESLVEKLAGCGARIRRQRQR